jgi:hypothetical protein
MTKRIVLVLSVMAVALALAAGIAMAQATTERSSEEIPFEGTITNPCNGEEVLFSYTIVRIQQVTTDDNGGTHTTSRNYIRAGRGTGLTSGEEYVLTFAGASSPQDPVGDTWVLGGTSTLNFVSIGGDANFQARVNNRETFNANGELTAGIYVFDEKCTG